MSNRTLVLGLVLIIIGLLLSLKAVGVMHFYVGDLFRFMIPLGLIALGFWLIAHRKTQEEQMRMQPQYRHGATAGETAEATRDSTTAQTGGPPSYRAPGKVKYSKVFGDMYIDCSQFDLQNTEITSFIGDIEVKLHGARLAKGLNRMIISGFIGDVRILIPPQMPVLVQSSNFIGDVELLGRRASGFGNNLDAQTPDYTGADSKLYIATNHFIGDVRVYEV